MRGRKKRKNVWVEYERRKRSLARRSQPSSEYEQQLRKITRELKL